MTSAWSVCGRSAALLLAQQARAIPVARRLRLIFAPTLQIACVALRRLVVALCALAWSLIIGDLQRAGLGLFQIRENDHQPLDAAGFCVVLSLYHKSDFLGQKSKLTVLVFGSLSRRIDFNVFSLGHDAANLS